MKNSVSRHRFYILCILLSASLLSTGCATKIRGWSQESYRSPDFNLAAIEREKVALLPVILLDETLDLTPPPKGGTPSAPYTPESSRNSNEKKPRPVAEGDPLLLDQILLSKLKSRLPHLQIVPVGDSLKRLNDAGLTKTYSRFVQNYPTVGIEADILQSFGQALSSRYLVYQPGIPD